LVEGFPAILPELDCARRSLSLRILPRLACGLGLLLLLSSASSALGCDQLPEGQLLWIRLSSPVSTYSAHVGDPVHAVLTQDVGCGDDVLLRMGTAIDGVVRSKRKVGWGIRHETAELELEFNQAMAADGSTIQMSAQVEEVENAREQLKNGVIHGVLSSDTFQGRINSRLIHLPTWNPYSDLGLIVYKATFPIFPEPEIYYPAGTDIRLKMKAAVFSLPIAARAAEDDMASVDTPELDAWIQKMPQRATTTKSVSADLMNLAFIGSREEVQAAFLEAGWHTSDSVSKRSFAHSFYALLNNSGYAQQPMKTFLLDGKPQDMSWQKGLNSYGRRDHLRIWQSSIEGSSDSVWIASSTHDTSAVLSVKYHGFLHHISPDIDDERAKVIRDLNFAGCVRLVSYVSRPLSPTFTQNATGDWVRTDGSLAVVQLKQCQPANPELDSNSNGGNYKPGNHVFRYLRREILTVRSDIWRANIIYGAYDVGRMTVIALRHPPVVQPIGESHLSSPLVARLQVTQGGSQ
jgi:LssY C-terminus